MFNAGVIGLGQIGLTYDLDRKRPGPNSHSLAYELHPNINFLAGHDIREEQKIYLKQIAPNALFYNKLDEMLTFNKFDIVSVCSPPSEHLSIIKRILELSSPRVIFCEKPVVSGLQEVKELKRLFEQSNCLLVPNLSRRWNKGVQEIASIIMSNKYGKLQKIHIRYTRGIYNTGSHLFDLIRFLGQTILEVRVLYKVSTSSDRDNDPSFSFVFTTKEGADGFAEAFNDENYYMFEVDLYFESGKVEFRMSGDQIRYLEKGVHPLFSGFSSLDPVYEETGLLAQSNLKAAVAHIIRVINKEDNLISTLEDGIYPLYVASALSRSFLSQGSLEQVGDEIL